MGIKLMVEVLEWLPEDTTAAERVLLLALAEKARDETREVIWRAGENPRVTLRRRTGLTESGLTKVMRRLADRGLDPRVPIKTDKRGRPVFAHEGAAARYRIPVIQADLLGNPLPTQSLPHREGSEPALQGTQINPHGQALNRESLPAEAPLVPQSLMSPAAREAAALLLSRYPEAVTEAEAAAIATRLAADCTIRDAVRFVQSPKVSLEDLRRKAAMTVTGKMSDFEKCEHQEPKRVIGAGANASWKCGKCESQSPYVHEAAVAS